MAEATRSAVCSNLIVRLECRHLLPNHHHHHCRHHRPHVKPPECSPGFWEDRRREEPFDDDCLDRGSCRVHINDARREIDRLRRGVDSIRLTDAPQANDIRDVECHAEAAPAASPVRTASSTSASIGAVRTVRPAERPEIVRTYVIQGVTNLGSLIDVLI